MTEPAKIEIRKDSGGFLVSWDPGDIPPISAMGSICLFMVRAMVETHGETHEYAREKLMHDLEQWMDGRKGKAVRKH